MGDAFSVPCLYPLLHPIYDFFFTFLREKTLFYGLFSLNPGVDAIGGLSLLLVLSFAPTGFSPGTPVFPSP